jgi:hypothetical protein
LHAELEYATLHPCCRGLSNYWQRPFEISSTQAEQIAILSCFCAAAAAAAAAAGAACRPEMEARIKSAKSQRIASMR